MRDTPSVLRAIRLCRRVLQQRPAFHQPHMLLTQIYVRQREWKAAAASLRAYRKGVPQTFALRLQQVTLDAKVGSYALAIRELKALCEEHPKSLKLQVQLLMLYRKSKQFVLAERKARRLLARLPKGAVIYRSLVLLYHDWGRYQKAVLVANVALQSISPNDPEIHHQLAHVYLKKRDEKRAISHFEQAIRYAPSHRAARLQLGTILMRKGYWRTAVKHFRAVVKAHPHDLYALRGYASGLVGLRRMAKAKALYLRILSLVPRDPEALFQLGVIHFASPRIEHKRMANEYFTKFMNHPEARRLQQYPQARAFIKQARERLKVLQQFSPAKRR